MTFKKKIALLMILAASQMPCAGHAAEEDKDLALIAAEQETSAEDEQLGEINPALTESISTARTQDTDKEIKARKKKLEQARKEKEKINERRLKESAHRNSSRPYDDQTIVIDPNAPTEPSAPLQPVAAPPKNPLDYPNQKVVYSNFAEVARAVKFVPLYMPKKSGYEITSLYAEQGVAEIRYGRRWEPTVSLTVKTHKRVAGEEPQDISGVTGVKWRVDNSTGTTFYIAKVSETYQVAAWAVGHYTFSAQAENLSYAGFHSLVSDELIELSTHYYMDL